MVTSPTHSHCFLPPATSRSNQAPPCLVLSWLRTRSYLLKLSMLFNTPIGSFLLEMLLPNSMKHSALLHRCLGILLQKVDNQTYVRDKIGWLYKQANINIPNSAKYRNPHVIFVFKDAPMLFLTFQIKPNSKMTGYKI